MENLTINTELIDNFEAFWSQVNRPEKTKFIRSYENYFNRSYDTFRVRMRSNNLTTADKEYISRYFSGEQWQEMLQELVKYQD